VDTDFTLRCTMMRPNQKEHMTAEWINKC